MSSRLRESAGYDAEGEHENSDFFNMVHSWLISFEFCFERKVVSSKKRFYGTKVLYPLNSIFALGGRDLFDNRYSFTRTREPLCRAVLIIGAAQLLEAQLLERTRQTGRKDSLEDSNNGWIGMTPQNEQPAAC